MQAVVADSHQPKPGTETLCHQSKPKMLSIFFTGAYVIFSKPVISQLKT